MKFSVSGSSYIGFFFLGPKQFLLSLASEDVFSLPLCRDDTSGLRPVLCGWDHPIGPPAGIRVNSSNKNFWRLGYLWSSIWMKLPNDLCFGQFSSILEYPASSKFSVVSPPACSLKTSYPPVCSSKNLVKSYTLWCSTNQVLGCGCASGPLPGWST